MRDYINVEDLAQAHIKALEYLKTEVKQISLTWERMMETA